MLHQILSEIAKKLSLLAMLMAAVIAVPGPTNACYLFINSIVEGCKACNKQKGACAQQRLPDVAALLFSHRNWPGMLCCVATSAC